MNKAAQQLAKLAIKKRYGGMTKEQIREVMTAMSKLAAKKRIEKARLKNKT
jgi:hypothetical protein